MMHIAQLGIIARTTIIKNLLKALAIDILLITQKRRIMTKILAREEKLD